jgi:hypothetical protein
MGLIRKYRKIFVFLLVALFLASIGQTCRFGTEDKADYSDNLVLKADPYIAGSTSVFSGERLHQHVLFWSAKIFSCPNSSSFYTVSYISVLLYISNNSNLSTTLPSILGFICKLQI